MATTIAELTVSARENGYKMCFYDITTEMVRYQAENPIVAPIMSDLLTRFQLVHSIRHVSSYAPHEDVIKRSEK